MGIFNLDYNFLTLLNTRVEQFYNYLFVTHKIICFDHCMTKRDSVLKFSLQKTLENYFI